ncbi:DNA cytosine methyltransferase [Massilia genomosp. 1]|uniref:DNA (cytosine-5-)-methyltransferase n=1 Tax=Massilia genomosp. 1 TaxID=2609280 RepID=A0ABX0N3C8_9BURK|nr:DNA cytosine methyltransferase [Massilia genomosp. 1]NHZ66906.1 hypothetical protein [Massilia genomosp. 1]
MEDLPKICANPNNLIECGLFFAKFNNEDVKNMPVAVSLFFGCGGSDAGVTASGFNLAMATDLLPYARDVYMASHAETDYRVGDVKNHKFSGCGIIGQMLLMSRRSQGGVRDPARKINKLYLEFAPALTSIRPEGFIVENVSGIVRSNFSHLLEDQFRVSIIKLCLVNGFRAFTILMKLMLFNYRP